MTLTIISHIFASPLCSEHCAREWFSAATRTGDLGVRSGRIGEENLREKKNCQNNINRKNVLENYEYGLGRLYRY